MISITPIIRAIVCLVVPVTLILSAISPAAASAAGDFLFRIEQTPPGAVVPGHLRKPGGVKVDRYNHIWVGDTPSTEQGQSLGGTTLNDYTYDGTPLAQNALDGRLGSSTATSIGDLDIDESSDYMYVASGQHALEVLNSAGQFVAEYDPLRVGVGVLAIDNSGSRSSGRLYMGATTPTGQPAIRALDSQGRPVDFSASGKPGTSEYIEGSYLVGTPNHKFSLYYTEIAVDSDGNIWVMDIYGAYKFAPSGEFITEFEGPYSEFKDAAIDPRNNHLLIQVGNHSISEYDSEGKFVSATDGNGMPPGDGEFFQPPGQFGAIENLDVDQPGRLYVADGLYFTEGYRAVHVFAPEVVLPKATYGVVTEPTTTSGTIHATVDPNGGGPVTGCVFKYGLAAPYESSKPCSVATPYGGVTNVSADLTGLTPETTYHYRVEMTNAKGTSLGRDETYTPHRVLNLKTEAATAVGPTSAQLEGSFQGNGENTRYYFEWGSPFKEYTHRTAVPPGPSAGAPSGPTNVAFELEGLKPVTTYHYRIVAGNGTGVSVGEDRFFTTHRSVPLFKTAVSNVHTDSALLKAVIDTGGGAPTTYHFEFGKTNAYGTILPVPEGWFPTSEDRSVSASLKNLEPGTTYHYRIVAENRIGENASPDRTFTTYPQLSSLVDPCPNALARQQTGAALTLDCRAYELVSATDTSGFDVESDLVPSQEPFGGYPRASDKVLYSVDSGAIAGTGRPTNHGRDTYVASRGSNGWSTTYVGIPVSPSPSLVPFGPTLGEANSTLTTLAFAGQGLCAPCFEDGKTGIPVHRADGSLVQGMAGSLDPGPTAKAEILVRRRLSSDGRYLVFGSTNQFELDAPNGQPAIYRRDLEAGDTRVISKTPAGTNIACLSNCATKGIAGLDMSDDGSRVIVGQLLGTDADGNDLWHPYMNIDGGSTSIDLAPGTTSGVSYAGMTRDGSKVFFSSADHLASGDSDTSVDLYQASVVGATATLSLLSDSNSDACNPVPNSPETGGHWNTVGPDADCSVAAIGGGGGVAGDEGTVFFLSPELLDGGLGSAGEPNLYVLHPGSGPEFVATLEPDNPAVVHAVHQAEQRNTADFQVTPSGDDAVFTSTKPLIDYDNAGHRQVYRYHASNGRLDCASCASFTNVQATVDASLASNGLSVTDDGRVFFTTAESLSLNDSNERQDVYEWNDGEVRPHTTPDAPTVQLISSGVDTFDSGLLSVSADGIDAYFFTRETLVSEDRNGALTKIYDARENGGFFVIPPPPPCVASDECHGPGSEAPGPPSIRTIAGIPGNAKKSRNRCRARKSHSKKKKGKCVRRGKRQKARSKTGAHR